MNIADDFEFETFERGHLWGMVSQKQNPAQSQIVKDLGSNSVVTIQAVARLSARLQLAQTAFLHQCIRAQLMRQVKTLFALSQVKKAS